MPTPTVSEFLMAMRSYLGVYEVPYGSNRTRVGLEFGWNGVAWCAETISVAAQRAGFERKFWSASTDQWERDARNGVNGARWISSSSTPRPGDCAVWDYSRDGTANHISVVESVRYDGKLITIGGNESNRCQRAVRSKFALRGYVRLPFRTVVIAPKPPTQLPPPTNVILEEDDDMAVAVKGNKSGKIYATNWIHKNHIPEPAQYSQMVMAGLKTNKGNPFVVDQETIDGIPGV